MSNPFISICIPAYKKVQSLKRLLQSIASQTYTNYEIIITDDSPDDSVTDLVKTFSATLPIQYFKNNPAAGTPGNWNIAIQKANGAWIKLMHDDDWFSSPVTLEKFAATAAISACSFIFSACNNIYTSSGKEVPEFLTGWRKDMLEENSLNLFYLNVIGHPSTVMHRKDATIQYDTQFKWVVDIDFYILFLQKNPGFDYIPEMLINIGTDDAQLSHSLYKNPHVEVPEYLTMLAKFPASLLMQHEYVFHCVWNLVKRFRLSDIKMIEELGYNGPLPNHLQSIINYQKAIPRLVIKQPKWSKIFMKKCFSKIKKNYGLYK